MNKWVEKLLQELVALGAKTKQQKVLWHVCELERQECGDSQHKKMRLKMQVDPNDAGHPRPCNTFEAFTSQPSEAIV